MNRQNVAVARNSYYKAKLLTSNALYQQLESSAILVNCKNICFSVKNRTMIGRK